MKCPECGEEMESKSYIDIDEDEQEVEKIAYWNCDDCSVLIWPRSDT